MIDKRILVIEDEIIHAKDLKNQLAELGYENILVCRNAKEALPLINGVEFDLVFVDVVLQGSQLNGIALAKKIMELRDTPLIFLTGSSDEDTTDSILKINSSAHLVKPVKINSLRVHIQRAFAKKNTSKPLVNTTSGCPFRVEKEYIFIAENSGNFDKRIHINDLNYVRSDGNYSYIFTDKGDFTVATTLKSFIEQFSNSSIVRVSRFYAVNKMKIIERNNKVLIFDNGLNPIKIGRTYKKNVDEHFETLKTKKS